MDEEVKNLLKENIELSKINNQMLEKLIDSNKRARIIRYIYWGVIIFSSIGAYYFIQPLIGNLFNLYAGGVSGVSNIGDISKTLNDNKQQMQDFVNSMNSN